MGKTSFVCLNYSKLRRGKCGNRWSVKVTSVMFQLRQKRGEVELKAFVPYSNFPASRRVKHIRHLEQYMAHNKHIPTFPVGRSCSER